MKSEDLHKQTDEAFSRAQGSETLVIGSIARLLNASEILKTEVPGNKRTHSQKPIKNHFILQRAEGRMKQIRVRSQKRFALLFILIAIILAHNPLK